MIPPPQRRRDDRIVAAATKTDNSRRSCDGENNVLRRTRLGGSVRQIRRAFPEGLGPHAGRCGIAGSSDTVVSAKRSSSIRKTAVRAKDSGVQLRNKPLRDMTGEALRTYFRDLNGHKPNALYDLVLGEVEPPLFEAVLDYTRGNQSRAAEILGLNRATLRKKLKQYDLLG
jgi:Fis family transcriptional regulator